MGLPVKEKENEESVVSWEPGEGSEVEEAVHGSSTMKAETNLRINNMEAIGDLDRRGSDERKGENIICMCL